MAMSRGSLQRTTSAAPAAAPKRTTAAVRQSNARRGPSPWAGQRAARRSAPRPHVPPRTAKASGSGSRSVAGEGQLDERGVRLAGRSRGGPRCGLAVISGAADVEVDPRLGDELAEEEAALHEGAFRRPAVAQLGRPGLHVVHVLVDERHLPDALRDPPPGRGDLVDPSLRPAEG